MDFRIGYRRPLRTATLKRKRRQRTRLWLAAVAAVTVAVTACTWEPGQPETASKVAAAPTLHVALNSQAPAPASAARRIYPYSIVPGGVASRDDIVRRVTTDKVVAEHYASFDIKKAHTVSVEKPRAVHVSYRKGDKVYWTAKKVMLAQGETLLSDGTHDIRGRCGNRISDTAQLPVAMNEPSAEELDASMNVAPPGDDGSLQNASFGLDDPAAGNPTSFQRFASFSLPSDAPAAAPPTRSSMPGMPAGTSSAMGLGPTRYLAASSSPALVLGPVDHVPAADTPAVTPAVTPTVTPDAPVATPGPTTIPETPVTPGFTPDPSTPPLAVTPEGAPLPPVTVNTPDAPTTPVVPVTPSTPATPVPPATPDPAPPVQTPVPEGEVPEPGTLWLFGAAFLLLAILRKKTR